MAKRGISDVRALTRIVNLKNSNSLLPRILEPPEIKRSTKSQSHSFASDLFLPRFSWEQQRSGKASYSSIADPRIGHKASEAKRQNSQRWLRRRRLTGWRSGVICSCLMVFCILLINISAFAWVYSHNKIQNGSGTFYKGDCDKAKSTNTRVQIGINILGTLLLGSSNYCMQCLGAPTREEVDCAHAKRFPLFVGVPSIRNLRTINGYRTIVWILLGLTALPIHFL